MTPRPAAVLLASVLAALVLAGCATPVASPSGGVERPATPAVVILAEAVTGTGATEFPGVEFPIPAESRSVVIEFSCVSDEGWFTVELGDSMMLGQGVLDGPCDGAHELAWPIVDRTTETLHVGVADGEEWTAVPSFSTGEFVFDTALTADCEAFSGIYSALTNADDGYGHYDAFGVEEWAARVEGAVDDLAALAAQSGSRLAELFAQAPQIGDGPGQALSDLQRDWGTQLSEIGRACNVNHTPLVINAEFGG